MVYSGATTISRHFNLKSFTEKKLKQTLSLADLDSEKVPIKVVPRMASQTFKGQRLVKPLVNSV